MEAKKPRGYYAEINRPFIERKRVCTHTGAGVAYSGQQKKHLCRDCGTEFIAFDRKQEIALKIREEINLLRQYVNLQTRVIGLLCQAEHGALGRLQNEFASLRRRFDAEGIKQP